MRGPKRRGREDCETRAPQTSHGQPRSTAIGYRALLAGTALVSTLLFSGLTATPANAQQAVNIVSIFPVNVTNNNDCILIGFIGNCANILTAGLGASINFTNTGNFATIGATALGINLETAAIGGPITLNNSGNIATLAGGAIGINTVTAFAFSPIDITNTGDIATAGFGAIGINAVAAGTRSSIDITNRADIATLGLAAIGINAVTAGNRGHITVTNSGNLATLALNADGIRARTTDNDSDIMVTNTGDILTQGRDAEGMDLLTEENDSSIMVDNMGTIRTSGRNAEGINAVTKGLNSEISIKNGGDVLSTGAFTDGIFTETSGANSRITIQSSGSVRAEGGTANGISATATGPQSPIEIHNAGELFGSSKGIHARSNTSTSIYNSGDISAGSGLAIDTIGATSSITNSGLITGFVDLTNSSDTFTNQSGGEFRAMETSNFRDGSDLFRNLTGGTLRTAHKGQVREVTKFVGLERFENSGLITMVDQQTDDEFRISNMEGGTNLSFIGTGDSTLAVDTFLGGPGSTSDRFFVEGSTTGGTLLTVNNTNPGSGVFNPDGIPVVFVDGNVDESNFFLAQPIDAGFFDYDLFFVPTNSGFFELRSHPGGGAHVLPHVVEFTHVTFHNSTETWFDRSTDLRVLLARGDACTDQARRSDESYMACQELYSITPGVWARGAGTWLELEDKAVTRANGRTYRHNLERNLDIWQLETGVDFGKRDWLRDGDALVLGVLGGAIQSTLDYKVLNRTFDIEGWEVGAYATYLRGGFFFDTLFKTIFSDVNPKSIRGFPDTLDNTTYGIRADTGYRFGGMDQGPFIEPLATIAASWTQIDDFTRDGNTVDFDDDENVRGRLGLRLGTSTEVWEGTTMEPFVVGSLWGTLSGSHSARLISNNTTFVFTDDQEDIWGEVSGGVNFFNPGAQTSVFAKVDYTFADETQGIGIRGGMRYNW